MSTSINTQTEEVFEENLLANEVNDTDEIEITAYPVKQMNQDFLIGVYPMKYVKNFTRYTKLLIVDYDEETNLPIYNNEIQRKINSAKVESISEFLVNDPDAQFPTNIVLAVPYQAIESIDENENVAKITLKKIVQQELKKKDGHVYITIIDGQHRIAGIEKAISKTRDQIFLLERSNKEKDKKELDRLNELFRKLNNFQLVISFFIGPTLEYQAMLFSTINRTQTKVPENLVYTLFGLSTTDSPQKTSLEITMVLNATEGSPFYNRINLAGATYKKGQIPPLSMATVVKSILKYISGPTKNSEIERHKGRKYVKEHPDSDLPFRYYYGNDDDKAILRIMFVYFKDVQMTFVQNDVSLWDIDDKNITKNILQTTVGYEALLLLLKDLLLLVPEEKKDKIGSYTIYLKKAVGLDFFDIAEEGRYPLTSKTRLKLYEDLVASIGIEI